VTLFKIQSGRSRDDALVVFGWKVDSPAENQRICWIFEICFWEGFWPSEILREFLGRCALHHVKFDFTLAHFALY